MKKIFAISLLVIYLFNLIGYSFYYHYCISQSDEKMVAQLDNNNYTDEELIEIKVPVNLPYYNNSNAYERIDGEIEVNGNHYNYVKRRISNDTVYLKCIPNIAKTQLYKDKSSYASQANDLPSNNKDNSTAKKNGFSNEYVGNVPQYTIAAPVVFVQSLYNTASYLLPQGHCSMQVQPPKQAA